LRDLGLVLGELRLRLQEGRLEGARIDGERSSPCFTSCPSVKWILNSSPPTSERTETVA
jgi:hypothetical protein